MDTKDDGAKSGNVAQTGGTGSGSGNMVAPGTGEQGDLERKSKGKHDLYVGLKIRLHHPEPLQQTASRLQSSPDSTNAEDLARLTRDRKQSGMRGVLIVKQRRRLTTEHRSSRRPDARGRAGIVGADLGFLKSPPLSS
ncbi:unnamed protein product [Brassica oleracea var. botrytis]